MYPSAVQASHRDSMIPRSWNDFGPFSWASVSTTLVDPVAGDGSGDDCREGFLANSGVMCVDVDCFNFFDMNPSALFKLPWAFRFMNGAILRCFEYPPPRS